MSEPIIELHNVSKHYFSYPSPKHRLLDLIRGNKRRYAKLTKALDEVSLSLMPGSRLGIVGVNGSGKSTLLKVLSGVLTPTTGRVTVRGRISALLELGAGFNPELSGLQNIQQFCLFHGLNRSETEQAIPEIIHFSELADAINQPVKTYSSGMAIRLGFACAVYVKPDILIVDEALSVGDTYFQNKCMHKIKALLEQGITFIYVTHAADSIRLLCQEGIWLENGHIRLSGPAPMVGAAYQSDIFQRMVRNDRQAVSSPQPAKETVSTQLYEAFAQRVMPLRTGSGQVRILNIEVFNEHDEVTDQLEFKTPCRIQVLYQTHEAFAEDYALAVGITDQTGRQLLHFNSQDQGLFLIKQPSAAIHIMEFSFTTPLCPGEYGVIAGVSSFSESPTQPGQLMVKEVIDYCAGGARFSILYPPKELQMNLWGVLHAPCVITHVPKLNLNSRSESCVS